MVFLASGGGLNLLEVNPGLVFWTVFTFLVVVLVLKKFAWDPILKALDARAEKIHGDIDKATELKTQAEELYKSYEAKIIAAKDEAVKIVDEAKKDAGVLRNKMLEDTSSDIKHLKDQSLKDIELAKAKAVKELHESVVELSVQIAGQILEKKLKSEDYSSFVQAEIGRLKNLKV
ncbi:MAG: F0F1 ATP synthase subunit B [Leptospira sp.]|nr:F0F1 ATP synthase subunit B [Leptospira sp.]